MKTKYKKTEIRPADQIGSVVAVVSDLFVDRFRQIALLENAAREILASCQKQKMGVWEDMAEKYNMLKTFHYNVDHNTKELTIIGIRRE